MGRPIDSQYFGDPAQTGSQLEVTYSGGAGYIIKQVGSRRFRCTLDGIAYEDCILSVDPVVAGTCNILVGGQLVSKLTAHRATLTDGTSVPWTDADLADTVPILIASTETETKPKVVKKPKVEKKKSFFGKDED